MSGPSPRIENPAPMRLRLPALTLLTTLLLPPLAWPAGDPLQPARAAREAALQAEAPRLATGTWIKAEERLDAASRQLEAGRSAAAEKRGAEARGLYASAELTAIKATLLTTAREQVLALGPAGTARLAPHTTARAQELLRAAESMLDADRSQTAGANDLAGQAVREAAHAMALASLLGSATRAKPGTEDLALAWEAALAEAATAAGLQPLPPGPEAATEALVRGLTGLKDRADQQADGLRQRELQVAALEEELRELDTRLAGASDQARNLTEQIEAREHARAQYEQLAAGFRPDQATVLRQGDDIILRLTGLSFTSGTARFAPGAKPLLDGLAAAPRLYPGARFTVEGHADASGDSAANQRLSQARADAVRDYMVKELQLAPGRISAAGYGDSRPVASNASAEGRRQNRRIDLVITPLVPAP